METSGLEGLSGMGCSKGSTCWVNGDGLEDLQDSLQFPGQLSHCMYVSGRDPSLRYSSICEWVRIIVLLQLGLFSWKLSGTSNTLCCRALQISIRSMLIIGLNLKQQIKMVR